MTKPIKDLHPQYIVNEKGEKTSVVLSIKEFEEILEDIQDLAEVAKRKNEKTTSHKDFIKELAKDGYI